jgi:hypothetical protein
MDACTVLKIAQCILQSTKTSTKSSDCFRKEDGSEMTKQD